MNVCGADKNIGAKEIMRREEWASIDALEKENVYVINDALLTRPGPRLAKGAKQIEDLIN